MTPEQTHDTALRRPFEQRSDDAAAAVARDQAVLFRDRERQHALVNLVPRLHRLGDGDVVLAGHEEMSGDDAARALASNGPWPAQCGRVIGIRRGENHRAVGPRDQQSQASRRQRLLHREVEDDLESRIRGDGDAVLGCAFDRYAVIFERVAGRLLRPPLRIATHALGHVRGDHFARRSALHDFSGVEPDHVFAELGDEAHVVTHDEHGPAGPADVLHLSEAFSLERDVADRENFVNDQHVRLEMRGDGECETDVHAGRVTLHRRVDERLDFGEGDDLIELAADLRARHAEDRAIEKHVLASRQLGMKSDSDFEQTRDASEQMQLALGRLGDVADDLEERALARAVSPDHAEDFGVVQIERDVAQGPERLRRASFLSDRADRVRDAVPQRERRRRQHAQSVLLADFA